VAGKGSLRGRIVNDGSQRAEIALKHRGRRHRIYALKILPLRKLLVVRHEEEPVPAVKELGNGDRAVQLESIIVELEGRLLGMRGRERVWRGVESVITHEFE